MAQPDRPARLARRVQLAPLVRRVLPGLPDLRVLPALRVLRDLRARRDPPELLALRGQLVLREPLVQRAPPALLGLVSLAPPAPRVLQVQLVLRVQLELGLRMVTRGTSPSPLLVRPGRWTAPLAAKPS